MYVHSQQAKLQDLRIRVETAVTSVTPDMQRKRLGKISDKKMANPIEHGRNRPVHIPNSTESPNYTNFMAKIRNSFYNMAWALSNLSPSVPS
ncbi:hypothetical protein AVEN_248228-1 [Araneus ventricosus]|uniref:Uncharacterized protein n=1 Tax=Araneus ventricosus TaxID=182803 RepID=A0A4Y2P6P7_ARAVE|nr:hypothetical protein AVEN_248228-1 [Araneus ventricosus]